MPFVQIFNKELAPNKAQALRFALWIGMATIVMFFAAITSAYLVRKPAGNWYEFKLPIQFFYSTIIIFSSSLFLELCYRSLKGKNESKYKLYLLLAFLTGIGFVISQIFAFKNMVNQGLFIDLNVSVSFIFVIAGMHILHILGGLIAYLISITIAFTTLFKIDELRILKFDLLRQYWHFIGILWIYLLVFLILQ
ncbi:MAG: cytochrome oxidase subunit III [Saprospiraceae bacterium]|nr:cytochrome oxidase subunit III [Saprospiraceae bacterium]